MPRITVFTGIMSVVIFYGSMPIITACLFGNMLYMTVGLT